MAFDPSISFGNLLTIGTVVVGGVYAWAKLRTEVEDMRQDVAEIKEANAGIRDAKDQMALTNTRTIERFERLQCDVGEIKLSLKQQDENRLAAVKADAMADGLLSLLSYRVTHLEQEMARARANIHRIANELHVQITTLEERVEIEEGRKKGNGD